MNTVFKFTCTRKVKIVINFQIYSLVISIFIFAYVYYEILCVIFLDIDDSSKELYQFWPPRWEIDTSIVRP